MGVPKLFKYLSDRYPSLSQTVTPNMLPHYDYFYIDLNFLLHKAVNEKNALPLEKVDNNFFSESRIFERVLRQIETLHRIVPSKVLFLSIDGVAPRAKWNTQRERRLLSFERNGLSPAQFDTNSISPGTVFMRNFETALMEFIANKIGFHTNWQNCEIYVSGSNVPGEGSLKITDFIRSLKQSQDYKPNETHCIYSGDNDYLLLGIATHELYISFIQEQKNRLSSLGSLCSDDVKHKFSVVHFELLRQYLRMEFIECQSEMSFEFNMDSIVDDWVVLMALIGNDYIPALPKFELDVGILSIIYDAYKEVLKTSNGYINEYGLMNVRRFARLLQILKPKDFDLYSNSISEQMAAVHLNGEAANGGANGGEQKASFSDFLEMKDEHYAEHLGVSNFPNLAQMSISYVTTVQWMLLYYFRGTFSWSYHYPYKCAPFVSDFASVHNTAMSLEVDKPMKPFTHLLAILPKGSAYLMPTSYQSMIVDHLDMDDLLQKAYIAEKRLNPSDESRNKTKPMLKFQYAKAEKGSNQVKITEIAAKKTDRINNDKYLDRPLKRTDFKFEFSALNVYDWSSKLIPGGPTKPNPRIMITLKADPLNDINVVAKSYLNQVVYAGWPHQMVAKVVQIFDATKHFDGSTGDVKTTMDPHDFNTFVETLNTTYAESGIDIGQIKCVAFVAPLKWMEYKSTDDKSNELQLVEYWDDENWKPVAVQTMVKRLSSNKMPKVKYAQDVLRVPDVFLFGGRSHYYGEKATIADAQGLETHGRVNILSYKDQEPNFEKAKNLHVSAKTEEINEFKQLSSAATLLGISEKMFARITGSVLVCPEKTLVPGRKINIGLQMKSRNPFQTSVLVAHNYVKNIGSKFIYSQQAIDVVQQYMDKFPRVFEVLSTSEAPALLITDFDENNNPNGLEYIGEIRQWLQSLPYYKVGLKPVDLSRLSENAVRDVQKAVDDAYNEDAKVLKLKMKWQNLYIPDLNDVFAIPSPNAVYKLLDRVVIVRSGYPFPIGVRGTVIGIEPISRHIPGNDVTDNEIYALEILMDAPFKIQSKSFEFKPHQVFRTRSTNMLLNISHGRTA
ncbi:5'-3' exoribonuclease 1-like [Sitodiplosis mosellana]|uniref:5'-3' exoribonuclease 1-like n=1 Tax=Sitodiplosis mosellana TaxID=263140 RepID=UPI0024451EE9|nr:5'-3' exoribonuclease 1-like [Sitodiplosis mosellana]